MRKEKANIDIFWAVELLTVIYILPTYKLTSILLRNSTKDKTTLDCCDGKNPQLLTSEAQQCCYHSQHTLCGGKCGIYANTNRERRWQGQRSSFSTCHIMVLLPLTVDFQPSNEMRPTSFASYTLQLIHVGTHNWPWYCLCPNTCKLPQRCWF